MTQARRGDSGETSDLQDRLDRIEEAASEPERVELEAIVDALGRRSFGSALLLAGLVTLAPVIGDIPGVPTTMGVFVVLTTGQLLLGRERLWLPRWLRTRAVTASKLEKALRWLRPVARTIDRLTRPRLQFLVRDAATYVIATLSLLVGAVMPLLEFIPFSANAAGILLTGFGLSLTARDGLLAIITVLLVGLAVGLLVWQLT